MNNKEIWKEATVKGYYISSFGRLKGRSGKIMKLYINKQGYYMVCIRPNGRNGLVKVMKVHREVAFAFLPIIKNKPFINHIDGNKLNNNIDNLEWCTNKENVKHAFSLGLAKAKQGCNNTGSKLTEKDVIWIRAHYIPRDLKFGCRALAKKFGMAHSNMSRLINKIKYK